MVRTPVKNAIEPLTRLRRAAAALGALLITLTFSGVASAASGASSSTVPILAALPFLPMQEEFCGTEGGQLLGSFGGIIVVVFFFVIVCAILIGGAIESLPLTGWFNQIGFSIMGKIPIALLFVFIALSMLSMVDGTFGLSAPSCVPVVG